MKKYSIAIMLCFMVALCACEREEPIPPTVQSEYNAVSTVDDVSEPSEGDVLLDDDVMDKVYAYSESNEALQEAVGAYAVKWNNVNLLKVRDSKDDVTSSLDEMFVCAGNAVSVREKQMSDAVTAIYGGSNYESAVREEFSQLAGIAIENLHEKETDIYSEVDAAFEDSKMSSAELDSILDLVREYNDIFSSYVVEK